MACRLFGAKPLLGPMLTYCELGHTEQSSLIFQLNSDILIEENAFENVVCKMSAILFRP